MKIIIEFVIQNIEYYKEIKSLKNIIIFCLIDEIFQKTYKVYKNSKKPKNNLKNNFFFFF